MYEVWRGEKLPVEKPVARGKMELVSVSVPVSTLGMKVVRLRFSGGGVSDDGLAECALVYVRVSVRVFDLTASLDSESEILSISFRISQLSCDASQ